MNAAAGEAGVIQPVFPSDFDGIYPLLRTLDPRRPAERWRPIFEYGWRRPEQPVGYALQGPHGGGGFAGLVWSEVTVAGEVRPFCNLTSWVVSPALRGQGALLLLPLCRRRDLTITNLTAHRAVQEVFFRLGFQVLDTHWTILRPAAGLLLGRRAPGCDILTDPAAIGPQLRDPDRRIFEDHLPHAHHLLAVTGSGYCYTVFTVRRRWRLRTARLHHISDKGVFQRCWPGIHARLLRERGAVLAEADARLLSGVSLPGSTRKAMGVPRLFKPSHVPAEQVPDLYNEVVLLGLP